MVSLYKSVKLCWSYSVHCSHVLNILTCSLLTTDCMRNRLVCLCMCLRICDMAVGFFVEDLGTYRYENIFQKHKGV